MPAARRLRFETLEHRIALSRQAVAGDVTLDGTVDIFDLNAVSNAWGDVAPAAGYADANRDGVVDIFDVNVISDQWGLTVPDPPPGGYEALFAPPEGFTSAVMWMEAIQDLSNPEVGKVEVDAMRLMGIVNGQTVIISNDTFDEPLTWTPGGLYLRDPWYGLGTPDENRQWPMAVDWTDGTMTMNLTETNRVYHWWTPIRPLLPAGTTRVWAEADVRISGGAMVGAGIDYWRTPTAPWAGYQVNNREAGATGWYTAWEGWQTITILAPD